MQSLSQSPTDPTFVQNPYPVYAAARQNDAIWWWDAYDMPCALSYDTVRFALRDKRLGRECPAELQISHPPHLDPFYAIEAHSMLELEPPTHTRLRSQVLRAFTSRRIAGLGPEIAVLADRLIDAFPTEPFDLLEAFAKPLPVIVIARLLGVPETDAPQLLAWSNAMVAMYQANRTRAVEHTASEAALAFAAYLKEVIATKRRAPEDDLISTLIAASSDQAKLSDDEMITTCILLLNAGHEATVHTLGNATKTLLETGHRAITEGCVEELLRFDPPLHLFTRYVYEPVEIGGHKFKRGEQIACLLGAANRDPAVFADPDQFDPTRPITQNTSFGGGIHFCVGAPLARLEIKIALLTLFSRCTDLRLSAPPRYADIYHFHGLERLMVQT
ncbi:MAG: cytochrome P450 [Pseudomonadota bacterium]